MISSNRNRHFQIQCNRNRLHCKCNRNQRLHSRLHKMFDYLPYSSSTHRGAIRKDGDEILLETLWPNVIFFTLPPSYEGNKHQVVNIISVTPWMHGKDVTSHIKSSSNSSNLPYWSSVASLDTCYCVDLPRLSQPYI